MTQNSKKKHLFKVLDNSFYHFLVKKIFVCERDKGFFYNPLNKIKWGSDERFASVSLNSY